MAGGLLIFKELISALFAPVVKLLIDRIPPKQYDPIRNPEGYVKFTPVEGWGLKWVPQIGTGDINRNVYDYRPDDIEINETPICPKCNKRLLENGGRGFYYWSCADSVCKFRKVQIGNKGRIIRKLEIMAQDKYSKKELRTIPE